MTLSNLLIQFINIAFFKAFILTPTPFKAYFFNSNLDV